MKYSIVHIYVYGEIKKIARGSNMIPLCEVVSIVKWHVRIPGYKQKPSKVREPNYQREFINELVEVGLLKRIDKQNFQILKCDRSAPLNSLGQPLW